MGNIINGVATNEEGTYNMNISYNTMEEITMNENETDTITAEESEAITDIYGSDDRTARIDTAKKLSEQGCSVKEIAKVMHLDESEVHPLLDDKYDYFEKTGKNHEGYPDPTWCQASRRVTHTHTDNTNHKDFDNTRIYADGYSRPQHSRRYQLVGLIRKMAEMAGFEVVDRIVLKNKKTGEVLR